MAAVVHGLGALALRSASRPALLLVPPLSYLLARVFVFGAPRDPGDRPERR